MELYYDSTFYELLQLWLNDHENGGGRWNDMIRLRAHPLAEPMPANASMKDVANVVPKRFPPRFLLLL